MLALLRWLLREDRLDHLGQHAAQRLGDGVTIWDAQDRLVLWNRRILEMSPHLADTMRVGRS